MAEKTGFITGNKPHSKGGIDVIVKDTNQVINVESKEYQICKSAMESTNILFYKDKTNIEILDDIHKKYNCPAFDKTAKSGDFIVCKIAVADDKPRRRVMGTASQIVNAINGLAGGRVDGETAEVVMEKGGKIKDVTCSNCGWSWNKEDSDKHDEYVCHKCGNDNKIEAGGSVITYKNKFNKKYGFEPNESHSLKEIAKLTNLKISALQDIYDKGIGAYKTNPESVRPNVKSKEQWAMARVYSSVMGGKASKVDANELERGKMEKGGKVKKAIFDIQEEDERITISIKGIGKVILTETYPKYEFSEDISEDELEELEVDEEDMIGKIEHIQIEDKYKGQGYAKLLMNKAIEIAKEKGLMPLYLNASPMGTKGLNIVNLTSFYESFGFEVFLKQGNNNLMILKSKVSYKKGGGIETLLAPNGNKSNLTNEQWHIVRTPAFISWFGNWEKLAMAKLKDPAMDEVTLANISKDVSKVVDENGEPLVVYHGTTKDFNVFKIADKYRSEWRIRDYGMYFSNSEFTAKQYSLDYEYKTDEYQEWDNKLEEYKKQQDWQNWKKLYEEKRDIFSRNLSKSYKSIRVIKCFLNIRNAFIIEGNGDYWYKVLKGATEIAIDNKNDGIIALKIKEVFEDVQNTYVAFNPTQIKLADGSNTTFDGSNPDIRFEQGGTIEGLELIDKTDEFGEKHDVLVNGTKQGSISKSDEQYFVMSNSTRGGKPFPSKFFANLDKAKKYVYSKTKDIIPLNSKNVFKELGYEQGGTITDKNKEIYKKWKSLVNMSRSELENFYNSKEGKVAGLKPSEAKAQGIDSGRESARWIIKMKDTPVSEWTITMWYWANKQISFISRMSGNKGSLYDKNGNKTRKHTSLLIWGHNPEKYEKGGSINSEQNNDIIEFKTYDVQVGGNSYTESIYGGYDLDEAKRKFNYADLDDLSTSDKYSGGVVILEEKINKYRFIYDLGEDESMDDFSIEDYSEDDSIYELIEEGEYKEIETRDIVGEKDIKEQNEEQADELLNDTINYFKKLYPRYTKAGYVNRESYYFLIPIPNTDNTIELRLSNHSPNFDNIDSNKNEVIKTELVRLGENPKEIDVSDIDFYDQVYDNDMGFVKYRQIKPKNRVALINCVIYHTLDETYFKFDKNTEYNIINEYFDLNEKNYELSDIIGEIEEIIKEQIDEYDGNETIFKKGGKISKEIKVVLDEGYGAVLNKLFNEWNNIKNEKDWIKWAENIKKTKFGTYGTIGFMEVIDKFEFNNKKNISSFQKEYFITEVKQALNK
jgi:predicted GNAT family acetyltransferase